MLFQLDAESTIKQTSKSKLESTGRLVTTRGKGWEVGNWSLERWRILQLLKKKEKKYGDVHHGGI